MNSIRALLLCIALVALVRPAQAFVLIGLPAPNQSPDRNFTDDMGAPRDIKQGFRWNIPNLTYSFDASFVTFFGLDGISAVKEAFDAVNDVFIPADGAYSGVTAMDLVAHGFRSNYNTTAINTTAQNAQVMDVKSLVLGMLVNHMGLGNPHRHAFSINSISTNLAGTQWNFNVVLRNWDPITYTSSANINNVAYSYRLIHDSPPSVGVTIPPTIMDMEEFTSDISGNAYTAVAGIADAFYGNTALFWTDTPSLYGFGVYYHHDNAVGGQNKARHTLTYDDAGGLKYLYRTNNFVFESLDPSVVLVTPTQFLPITAIPVFPGPTGRLFPDSLGGNQGLIPRRNLPGLPPGIPTVSVLPAPTPPVLVDVALRGGQDRMQFTYQPFDSLLGVTFTATNQTWTDVFVSTNGQNVVQTGNAFAIAQPSLKFFEQTIGRAVFQPDIIFVADDLGVSPDGVPIAWDRTPGTNWIDNATNNVGAVLLTTLPVGPGIISTAGAPIQYTFNKIAEGFEVIWSGEASVVGNTVPYSLWGHIFGPGANDMTIFPNNGRMSIIENVVATATLPPTVSMVSDDGGLSPILAASLARTSETLTILGQNLASVVQIEIIDAANTNSILQTFAPTGMILSDQKISIPPGTINETTDNNGTASGRRVRVRNSVGPAVGPEAFGITTGAPVITGTSHDNDTFDRSGNAPLRVFGYGFKSYNSGTLTHLRVEDASGNLLQPASGTSTAITFTVLSDTEAQIPAGSSSPALSSLSDGASRRIRIARGAAAGDLSATNSVRTLANITTTPSISSVATLAVSGSNFRRDQTVEINGTALNTATQIEIVKSDGSSFSPAVVIELPAAGVGVESNGSRITISANTLTASGADDNNNTRRVKVSNLIGTGTSSAASLIAVNTQPAITAVAGFAAAHPAAFDRSQATGDDITITGTGLLAAAAIHIVDENGAALTNNPRITLPINGVTVTDTSIIIDTQTAQFLNGSNADSTNSSIYRRLRVTSARTDATSSLDQKFQVAVPPSFASVAIGSPSITGHFDRNSTLVFTGGGLANFTQIEIVDTAGNALSGVSALGQTTLGTGGSFNATTVTVGVNAFTQGNLLDSVTANSRRVKVTNPVGSYVSDTNATNGTFTVSALPTFGTTVQQTFAGGGYDGSSGSGTYTSTSGNLVINGANFRGVSLVEFLANGALVSGGSVSVNAIAPPAGYTFNADGTQLVIASTTIPMAWLGTGTGNASVRLATAATRTAVTPSITALAPPPTFTSLGGTGYTGGIPAYERNGTLIFTGTYLTGATQVEIVDNSGAVIPGAAALTSFTATATTISIASTGLDYNGTLFDTPNNSGVTFRRIKVTTPSGSVTSPASAAGQVTVSKAPTFSASNNAVFGSSNGAGGYNNGTTTWTQASGHLIITSTTANLFGVKTIYFNNAAGSMGSVSLASGLPVGLTINPSGTFMTLDSGTFTFPASWNNGAGRFMTFETSANRNATTPTITTAP